MRKYFDLLDLKIIESLATYGPRNISRVSRKLCIPAETLRKRIKRLYLQTFLRFHVNVHHANLGFITAVVFAEAVPGYEDALYDALKINDFWMFISRCYGMFEGCIGIFDVPRENCNQFERFISEIKKVGLARRTQIFWLTFFHPIPSLSKWFNQKTKSWNFNWEKWVQEIENADTTSFYSLVTTSTFSNKADEIDILLLKELEKDARINFKKLGEKLDISPQLVSYHYYNHILGRRLLESFRPTIFYFGNDSEFSFFIFSFHEQEKLKKFTSTLLDKPFVKTLGKILGKNELYGCLYFPRLEFRIFLEILSKLVRDGLLKSYQYVIQDLANSSRETIPYKCFKNGRWIYDHERYINLLYKFLEKLPLGEKVRLRPKIHAKINVAQISNQKFA